MQHFYPSALNISSLTYAHLIHARHSSQFPFHFFLFANLIFIICRPSILCVKINAFFVQFNRFQFSIFHFRLKAVKCGNFSWFRFPFCSSFVLSLDYFWIFRKSVNWMKKFDKKIDICCLKSSKRMSKLAFISNDMNKCNVTFYGWFLTITTAVRQIKCEWTERKKNEWKSFHFPMILDMKNFWHELQMADKSTREK